jgi:hypothetical protein
VTIAKRPFSEGQDAESVEVICPTAQAKFFGVGAGQQFRELARRANHLCANETKGKPKPPCFRRHRRRRGLRSCPDRIPIFLLRDSIFRGINGDVGSIAFNQMQYSIHDKTLDAKKARILINALIDCAKAGVRSSFSINKMLWGISLYLECGSFTRENWRTYHRVSDAAKQIRASGAPNWKKDVTFEHVRPLGMMYQMLLNERETLTLERAACIIGEYPPILITTKEEYRMAELGFKDKGTPEQRYAHIPMSGFSLRSEPPPSKAVRTGGG